MSLPAIIAIEAVRALTRPMPVAWVSAFGGWIGRKLIAGGKRQRRAMANLRASLPDRNSDALKDITTTMWDSYGRALAETLILDRIAADPDCVELANPEVLEHGAEAGTVFVGMHFGNWEVNALPALGRFDDLAGLYKPFKNLRFDAWVRRRRAAFYPGGLLEADASALLKAARQVRGGGAVCLLADHRDAGGVDVNFFGRPAPSSAFPAMLGRRFGARIIAARTDRLPGGRFRVVLERVDVTRSDDQDADITETTARLQGVFERWIAEAPGQWLWFYKRWRDNPAV